MSAIYRCDHCNATIDSGAYRIELDIVEDDEPIAVSESADDQSASEFFTATLRSTGFTPEHHFCSMGCLADWAETKRGLD